MVFGGVSQGRSRWLFREVRVAFFRYIREGMGVEQASARVGICPASGYRLMAHTGGVISTAPQPATGRFLSLAEREEIMLWHAHGVCAAEIARRLGRHRSSIGREIARNSTAKGYRASTAHHAAQQRARRPKRAKLVTHPALHQRVQQDLLARWSPAQISARLKHDFPDQPTMHISPETIYQSLFVQGRGALRRELTECLRTGRAIRRPRVLPNGRRHNRAISNSVMISQRPAQVADRAVPGHWEGDLIIGKQGRSAIGTVVERTTRFCVLLHLPEGKNAASVATQMINAMQGLPQHLRQSLTWDQGAEMAQHAAITAATDMRIYFCDPHSPWQRGSNENTNGLLRQYFPKNTDLSVHSPHDLAAVAAELNSRPRKTLRWRTPAEQLAVLLSTSDSSVATTT